MTHDDLLKKVYTDQELTAYINTGLINGDITINTGRQHWFQSNALEAVLKLHKPLTLNNVTHCPECQYGSAAGTYPCRTIQTIEKELG